MDREESKQAGHHERLFKKKFFLATALSLPVLYFSEFISSLLGYQPLSFPGSSLIVPVLSTIVFIYGGLPFLRMAASEFKAHKPGMMMLISLAILVAYTYSVAALFTAGESSFFWELVTLIDVMLLGHWVEMRSVRKAGDALNELASLTPDTAERLLPDGDTEEVRVSYLEVGDRILVRPGSRIPVDGEVIEGSSTVDESMITGESEPVSKDEGSDVLGGTINNDGSLRIEVTATGDDTALSGIIKLVEEAQESSSRSRTIADKAAGWLFYVSIGTALITAIAWGLIQGFNVTVVERVVTVLVIACPHALGLAVPLVVAINTSLAAKNGILVRNYVAMEQARSLDTVVFDKTGTLTTGTHGVEDVQTVDGMSRDRALALMAAVESDSEHVIAQAIREAADQEDVDIPKATGFEAMNGRGVKALVDGDPVMVGGHNLVEERGITVQDALSSFASDAHENARSVVYLFVGEDIKAAVSLADTIRSDSRSAVQALQARGVEVAMLTGDTEEVASVVADELDIDTYFAEVLPEDKDDNIQALQDQGKRVAMVGDGVNDAPALTRADVGIAIGSGTDVAVESADIILVQNNPLDLLKILDLSQASYWKTVQNLFWATGYNAVALPLAAGVLIPIGVVLNPAVGALIMSLSTVIVAVNAQLLRNLTFTDADAA